MEYFIDLDFKLLMRLFWWRLIGRKQRIVFDTQLKLWSLAEYPRPLPAHNKGEK